MGISGPTINKLQRVDIAAVANFVAMDAHLVRDLLTVVGTRMQPELRGVSCVPTCTSNSCPPSA